MGKDLLWGSDGRTCCPILGVDANSVKPRAPNPAIVKTSKLAAATPRGAPAAVKSTNTGSATPQTNGGSLRHPPRRPARTTSAPTISMNRWLDGHAASVM